jgi:large subunit ribosomal protein L34e
VQEKTTFKMVERQTLRRHVSWNTKSTKRRKIRTPGGRLVYQYVQKKAAYPKCGDTKKKLIGMPRKRPMELKKLKKRQKHVSRAYGGCISGKAVRQRIVRAFLVSEQACVKAVLQEKEKLTEGGAAKSDKKKNKKK